MANDAKWMKKEMELSFTPYPGMNFEGLAGEHSLKISGMSFVLPEGYFKIRLAWLTDTPLNSRQMEGWDIV